MRKEAEIQPESDALENDAPVFGVWKTWYGLVIGTLILIIILLTIFSRMFV